MINTTLIILSALVLCILLKKYSPEFSFLIAVSALILVFLSSIDDFKSAAQSVLKISSQVPELSVYIKIMFKILAVSILTQLVSDICRDNGESALASQAELGGRIAITVMALPLFNIISEIIAGLLK